MKTRRTMIMVVTFLSLVSVVIAAPSHHRSNQARLDFAKKVTCPSTGKKALPCPGYVIDHRAPLCAGGADDSGNMQWQEKAVSYQKDHEEMLWCRGIAKKKLPAYWLDQTYDISHPVVNVCRIFDRLTWPFMWEALCQ
jgi:hypothetical protein